MKVIVWGLGYVGTVVAACLAKLGHEAIGVDKVPAKVEALNRGKSPIKEPGLEALIQEGINSGLLRAALHGDREMVDADVSLICVGTPSAPDGSTELNYIESVAAEIGEGLRDTAKYHAVVLRSTVFPGTTRKVLLPILERHSQKRCGVDFGLVMNPEFLRETSAIGDFFDPPYTVLGEYDAKGCDLVEKIYREIPGEIYRVSLETAELLKQSNNAFHALKIGFANEIGRVCERLDINSQELMQLLCADTKLNISPAYLRPGFAFGGSCLPKDLRSITFHAQRLGVETPILESILPSNTEQVEAARLKVHNLNVKRVTILGLSFKPNTDDLRESPAITLIDLLWRDGFDLRVHDPDVQLETVLGSNLDYLERQLPQINKIYRASIVEAVADTQAVVLVQNRPEFTEAVQNLPPGTSVIDLVRPYLTSGGSRQIEKTYSILTRS